MKTKIAKIRLRRKGREQFNQSIRFISGSLPIYTVLKKRIYIKERNIKPNWTIGLQWKRQKFDSSFFMTNDCMVSVAPQWPRSHGQHVYAHAHHILLSCIPPSPFYVHREFPCGAMTQAAAADAICRATSRIRARHGLQDAAGVSDEGNQRMIGACRPSLRLSFAVVHRPRTPSSRVSDYGPRKQRLGINYTAPAVAVSAAWTTHRGSKLAPRKARGGTKFA